MLRAVVLHEHVSEVKPLLGDRPLLRSWAEPAAHGFDVALGPTGGSRGGDGVQDLELGGPASR